MKYIEVDSLNVGSVNELIYYAVETVCDHLDSGSYGKLEPLEMENNGILTRGNLDLINKGGRRKEHGLIRLDANLTNTKYGSLGGC